MQTKSCKTASCSLNSLVGLTVYQLQQAKTRTYMALLVDVAYDVAFTKYRRIRLIYHFGLLANAVKKISGLLNLLQRQP